MVVVTPGVRVPLYPIFLKVDAIPCLVVGAGEIGAQKAEGLVAAGAALVVVGRDIGPRMQRLIDGASSPVVVHHRAFAPSDCTGMRVVISATGDPGVDETVYAAAKEANALVNVVDVKDRCDFYAGSQVQQGPLSILIGTEGNAPSVAQYTRKLLARALPKSLGVLAAVLGHHRESLLRVLPDFAARAKILSAFVDRAAARCLADGDRVHHHRTEIEGWLQREVLAPATGAKDEEGLSILALALDFGDEGPVLRETLRVGGRFFSIGELAADTLGAADLATLADDVRAFCATASLPSPLVGPVIVHSNSVEIGGVLYPLDVSTAAWAVAHQRLLDAIVPMVSLR